MRVLITGGAGFIGSHLADAYLERGDEVHVLDDLSTGCIDNIRHLRQHPRFEPGNLEANLALVGRLQAMAREKGATPGQLALAWLLARGPDVVPIPGTKRRARLEENVGALGVQLTGDDVRALDEAVPRGAAAGSRYPAALMKAVYL